MTEAATPPLVLLAPGRAVKMGLPMAEKAMPSDEEGRLAAALRQRDPDALRELYERFGRITFGFLLRTIGDRGSAEDVQQQLFLEVWRRADSYDQGRGSLLTWVMTIARSRAIDHLRRRIPEPVDPEAAADAAEPGREAAEIDSLAEQWRLRALLDRLPDSEAKALRLRFYDELTQSEIAARENIPLGTVKTRMFNGLRRLREMIDEDEA